jgi:uncharacterized membrane protein required for colicin V production
MAWHQPKVLLLTSISTSGGDALNWLAAGVAGWFAATLAAVLAPELRQYGVVSANSQGRACAGLSLISYSVELLL